ncbi:hypothetical protein GF351_04605, partial [Candidatus Woesearchaeota archaeon]|nr:hypothetical protein [Candidatus Woesearchaeota archaeon]
LESGYLAQNYEDEFQELWSGTFGKGEKVRYPEVHVNGIMIKNYFSPDDDTAEKIEKEISEAEESVYFMIFSFTHPAIATEIVLAHERGLDVKGVMEKSQNSRYSRKSLFDTQGLDVMWDNNSANMHHKFFVIDEEIVITGSFNPSKNADERNDENILIIHDEVIAGMFAEEFRRMHER